MFDWFVTTINVIDKMNDEILKILVGFLVIVSTLFLWLWFYNRRKYHNLKHAIPANVVKSYLDSIIQNSTALKSQLFRGGGLDVGNVPSVLPLNNMIGGEGLAINGAPSTALMEELNQRRAQIAALEAQLNPLQHSNRELDGKLGKTQTNLSVAENKIKELEKMLSQANAGGGADPAMASQLNAVTKEKNDLIERLKEFEIIADDLANLKRLQQENEQLKRSLAAQGGSVAAAPTPTQAPVREQAPINQTDVDSLFNDLGQNDETPNQENNALDDFLSASSDSSEDAEQFTEESPVDEPSVDEPAVEVPVAAAPSAENKNEKTPEDLLSEFEKMLG